MKYAVITFGCRVNQADSLAIEAELATRGAEATTTDRADVVIVNTCSVTASADQGARQTMRRVARQNPSARIVATGCYATRCADEVAGLVEGIAVVRNDAKLTIPLLLDPGDGPCGRTPGPGLMGRTAWTLRVQTGCEERCSYCIIPTTRGASRSRTLDEVRAEIARTVAAGYREIAITGVHLGSYGRDLTPGLSLIDLLRSLVESGPTLVPPEHGCVLLRVSSLEPMDFPRELLQLVERSDMGRRQHGGFAIAPHFHLPLQHASNRILRVMQRPYTFEYYRDLVAEIRCRLPHASIGSDLIAGFPGETDDDFVALTAYLEASPLTHLHVFPYSDRPGTVASTLADKVHGAVTKARAQRLRDISRVLGDRFRAAQCGTLRPALTIEDGSIAVTDNYLRVPVGGRHERNEQVSARL